MATLAGENIPSVQKKNDNQFVIGISIETIVDVAKKGLGPESITPVCSSRGKIRVNLNLDMQYNNIS